MIKLNKKQDIIDEEFNKSDLKTIFINNFLPQIMNKEDRNKYFIKYEYPHKQQYLVEFWKMAVDKTFKKLIRGFCIKEQELIEIYTIDNCKPLSLIEIIKLLQNENKIIILNNIDNEIKKIVNLVDNTNNSLFKIIKNIFSQKSKNNDNNLNKELIDNDLNSKFLINKDLIKNSFENSKLKYIRIFNKNQLIVEKIFLEKFDLVCHLNRYDSLIIIRIFLYLKLLFRKKILIKNKIQIFYSIYKDNNKLDKDLMFYKINEELESLKIKENIFLNKKNDIENQIKMKIKLIKSINNIKEQTHHEKITKILLNQKNQINKKLEEINNKISYYNNIEIKLENEEDTCLLKDINNMLENQIDCQEKFNNELKDLDYNLKELEENDNQLEELYNKVSEEDNNLYNNFEKEIQKEEENKTDQIFNNILI